MIIDCISDLHGHYPKLEGGDLLIVAGDLTARDTREEYLKFRDWALEQNYFAVIVVAGNHDNRLQINKHVLDSEDSNIVYLQDDSFEYMDIKIWGSPWTKTFPGMNPNCMAFTVDTDEELAEKWALIPDDVDILITHSPPYDMLDMVRIYGPFSHEQETSVGSKSLLVRSLELKPKLHIFGHIHECGGKQLHLKRAGYGTENNTIYVNASHVNEEYKPVNKPIRVLM